MHVKLLTLNMHALHLVYEQRKACACVLILSLMVEDSDWGRRNCWIKSLYLFSLRTKYSRSFIKLRLNHWCHMDYFNNVLATFLGLECGSILAVYAGSDSSWILEKYLNLCSEDERFGTTWGWVINGRILILGRTIPLMITCSLNCCSCAIIFYLAHLVTICWKCVKQKLWWKTDITVS